MLTKAFIKELPSGDSNYFKVRVPLYEDNTGQEAIFDALLCSDPSNYNGYSVGDAVYVEFEDERLNFAVIMGKLFVETPKETTSYNLVNELKVTEHASLPPSTKLGDYTAQDLVNLYNAAGGGALGGTTIEEINNTYTEFKIDFTKWNELFDHGGTKYYSYILAGSESFVPEGRQFDIFPELANLTGDEILSWDILVNPEGVEDSEQYIPYKTQVKYRAWCTTLNIYYGYMELLAMKQPKDFITLGVKGLKID